MAIFSSIETIIQINETLLAKFAARLSKFPHETQFGNSSLFFSAKFLIA
jgi:hypothetical protein